MEKAEEISMIAKVKAVRGSIDYPQILRLALINTNRFRLTESDVESLKLELPFNIIEGYSVIRLGVDDSNTSHDLVLVQEGTTLEPHYHIASAGEFIFLSGRGTMVLNDQSLNYEGGDRIIVPKGVSHGFKTITETIFISLNNPPITDPVTGEVDFHYPDSKK